MHILLRDTLGANYRLDIYLIVIGCAQMQTFFSVQGTTSTQQQQQRTKNRRRAQKYRRWSLLGPLSALYRVSSEYRPRQPNGLVRPGWQTPPTWEPLTFQIQVLYRENCTDRAAGVSKAQLAQSRTNKVESIHN